jgi:cytochrome c-type biogenesis protein CcmE
MDFVLRAAVMSAIAIAFYVVRGFGSVVETFVMVLVASLVGHGVVRLVRSQRAGAWAPKLALAAVCVALVTGAVVVLLVPARRGGPVEYRQVDELGDPASLVGTELKLHGYVELGSMKVEIVQQEAIRTFSLASKQHRIRVRFNGPAPDTLKERAEVVALGRIVHAPDGTYELLASELVAKCPSTYQTSSGPKPASLFR